MKLNNQILEAIKRGINLALDDFEDQNDIQQQTHGKVKTFNTSKEYLALLDNFVDLGLPSGTLWSKYNLGVDPNNLETDDNWYGDYYAFGELKPKITTQYKFLEKRTINNRHIIDHYIKYNNDDKLIKLELCDDPAYNNNFYKKYHVNICVPTIDQYEELLANTTKSFNYTYNNVLNLYVCKLTSKINGNEIIFPIHGYLENENSINIKLTNLNYGYYMTSYIYPEWFDWLYYCMQIEKDNKIQINTIAREHGVMVRPVLMK